MLLLTNVKLEHLWTAVGGSFFLLTIKEVSLRILTNLEWIS